MSQPKRGGSHEPRWLSPASSIRDLSKGRPMSVPGSISDYLRQFGTELGERILQTYPALYKPGDPVSPRMRTLLRKPYPAQEVAAMSVVRRWQEAHAAAVIAECG